MANVFEIQARFMRRVQVKEYEPMEAEISIKVQLEGGEDEQAAIEDAAFRARETVIQVLKGERGAVSEPAVQKAPAAEPVEEPAASEEKPAPKKRGRPKKKVEPAPVEETPVEEAPAEEAKTAEDLPVPSPQEIQTELTKLIAGGQIKSADVKKILTKEFGGERIPKLSEEQRGRFWDMVEEMVDND